MSSDAGWSCYSPPPSDWRNTAPRTANGAATLATTAAPSIPTGSDRCGQLQRPPHRVALAVCRRLARSRGVARAEAPALDPGTAGDAADGRRRAVFLDRAVSGGGDRRRHRGDRLGLRPPGLSGGEPTHGHGSRGVAYWTDGEDARIFWGTSEGYLHAVDAGTGLPAPGFGDAGRVDLTEDIPRATRGQTNYQGRNLLGVESPPVIVGDVVVTPTIISDFVVTKEAPPGWLKGVDARTGDTGPPTTPSS